MKCSVFNSNFNNALLVLDIILFLIMWLPMQCFINGVSNFINRFGTKNLLKPFLFGPVLLVISIILLPVTIICFVIWTTFTIIFARNISSEISLDDCLEGREQQEYTFLTSNVMLGPDIIGKVQNMRQVLERLYRIGEAFSTINKSSGKPSRVSSWCLEQVVTKNWPGQVDFLCLQEVWDLTSTYYLMWKLRKSFKYFIYDISQDFSNSRFPFRPSGLFFASRFPILVQKPVLFDPIFEKFENVYQAILAHGFVMVKVDLGQTGDKRSVGFVCCCHLPAFEGNQQARDKDSLTILHEAFEDFREENLDRANEVSKFAVISGDTNLSNMCPFDGQYQDHKVFNQYTDLAMECPGKDKDWTVGTELRHFAIQDEDVRTAEGLEKVLMDEDQRHKYVLDAGLEHLDSDLVKQPASGKAKKEMKGRRRVDRIFYDPSEEICNPLDYKFITALASNTDHVPISLTIGPK